MMQQMSIGRPGIARQEMKPLGRNKCGCEEFLWLKDSSVMVKVPAGLFVMGSSASDAPFCEMPARQVYVSAFYIDKHPVTNRQFDGFVRATGYRTEAERLGDGQVFDTSTSRWVTRKGACWRIYFSHATENHPVVLVSWHDAQAYCNWARKRLPTEAEWEKAARGPDARRYPWGNEEPDAGGEYRANYWPERGIAADGYDRTSPVLAFSAGVSPYGILDLAGNVLEWCNDRFDAFDSYYAKAPNRNPPGPNTGLSRVLRGGSWYGRARTLLATARTGSGPASRSCSYGFRSAYSGLL